MKNLIWIPLGELTEISTDFSAYNKSIGIYRATLDGKIVYIGKATELNNGGIRKRLRDYTRPSASARNFPAGKLMHHHRNNINIDILVFDRGLESVPEINELEAKLIKEIKPIWNNTNKEL